jgi:hypothetical protein
MEGRLFERISLPVRLRYEVRTRPKLPKETVSKNISGNGICLSLSEKLLPKTVLDMSVTLASGDDIIRLSGQVVWCRRVEIITGEIPVIYYDTGIELTDADPININRIITYFYGKSF